MSIGSSRASPLPPSVVASLSRNGKVLVLTQQQLGAPDARGGRLILSTTFQVITPELMQSAKDRLQANVTFWSNPSWQVTVPTGQHWALVSDDGQSLVLIRLYPPATGQPLLTLYRKEGRGARLVRELSIADLWPPIQVSRRLSGRLGFTDATPQWFAGASFRVSADSHFLFYESQWKCAVTLDLRTGRIEQLRVGQTSPDQ